MERQEKMRGSKQDNRSFLAKYWMYIVPFVIFMLVSSALNPENPPPGHKYHVPDDAFIREQLSKL
ncbi:hypothetical protein BLOT_008530 [Blomia tropicalis]|nr:hypothetical protein BLOT_008530 [Blomia tropicalis]